MLAPGTRIDDRYEILSKLGSGGMGHVYKARRIRLGDEVAIKVMLTAAGAPADLPERFLRESRACAQLRHPNIVSILDFGVDAEKQPYMVMELLSGPSLAEEIDLDAPMPAPRVASVMTPVAAALDLAHDRGIIHRDMKPANIVSHRFESGERVYKVIDFGLVAVRAASDETRLTSPNLFLGTMAYAAPEQIRGDDLTPVADVYALGVIAYEMLTGARPFEAASRLTLINKILSERPPSPTVRRPAVSAAVDAAIMRALAKDAAERWPSAAAFAQALIAAAGPDPVAVTPPPNALLARYELGAFVGPGRLGSAIYRGTHRALRVPVAIRTLKPDDRPNWEAVRARFLLEARTLQVTHPSLLHVRDYGEDARGVFLVTDFIEGPSLRQALGQRAPFEWALVRRLTSQALDACAALNRRGGFIAGVNPDMIRLTADDEGERIVMSTAGIRSVQDVLATMREAELRGEEASELELPYVAPEILMGRAPDKAADIFTIGVLAYQMATGALPYRAPSLPELIGKMLHSSPTPPSALSPGVPPAASEAIVRAIAGSPDARFASASELSAALG
jgi:serine/threonine protein kinase